MTFRISKSGPRASTVAGLGATSAMSTTGRWTAVVAGWVTAVLSGGGSRRPVGWTSTLSRPSVGELVNGFTNVRDPDG